MGSENYAKKECVQGKKGYRTMLQQKRDVQVRHWASDEPRKPTHHCPERRGEEARQRAGAK